MTFDSATQSYAGSFAMRLSNNIARSTEFGDWAIQGIDPLLYQLSIGIDSVQGESYVATPFAPFRSASYWLTLRMGPFTRDTGIQCSLLCVTHSDVDSIYSNALDLRLLAVPEHSAVSPGSGGLQKELAMIQPNPATTIVRVEGVPGNEVAVYNAQGVEVLRTRHSDMNIDVSALPPGLYWVSLDHRFAGKLVIIR
jgi:hypothetical protein